MSTSTKPEKKVKHYLILGFKDKDRNYDSVEVLDAFSTHHVFVGKHRFNQMVAKCGKQFAAFSLYENKMMEFGRKVEA